MTQELQITTDGQTTYLPIKSRNKIIIFYNAGAAGTLTPRYSHRQGNDQTFELPSGATSITGSVVFDLTGPGYLSFIAAGVTGTIDVDIEEPE